MTYSLTGIAYLALFFALGFLTFRFFQYWKEKKDVTSKAFLFLGASFALFAFVRVVSVLFFAHNISALTHSIVAVAFIQSLAAAIVAYLIIHLKFPKVSPWLGFSVIMILGLIATILTVNIQYQPTLGEMGVFDWGFPSSGSGIPYSILRMAIILITFIPLIFILFQQFLHSGDNFIKRRSLGLSLVFLFAIVLGLIDFVLNNLLKLGVAVYRDYTTIFISFLIFLIILLTQKPRESENKTI